jgi:hypothetical protein
MRRKRRKRRKKREGGGGAIETILSEIGKGNNV